MSKPSVKRCYYVPDRQMETVEDLTWVHSGWEYDRVRNRFNLNLPATWCWFAPATGELCVHGHPSIVYLIDGHIREASPDRVTIGFHKAGASRKR